MASTIRNIIVTVSAALSGTMAFTAAAFTFDSGSKSALKTALSLVKGDVQVVIGTHRLLQDEGTLDGVQRLEGVPTRDALDGRHGATDDGAHGGQALRRCGR